MGTGAQSVAALGLVDLSGSHQLVPCHCDRAVEVRLGRVVFRMGSPAEREEKHFSRDAAALCPHVCVQCTLEGTDPRGTTIAQAGLPCVNHTFHDLYKGCFG